MIPYDIRMGVWVTVEGGRRITCATASRNTTHTDPSGRYFTLYKRWHLIGLEVGAVGGLVDRCAARRPAW